MCLNQPKEIYENTSFELNSIPHNHSHGSAPQYNNPIEYRTVALLTVQYDQYVNALPTENIPDDDQLMTPPPVELSVFEEVVPDFVKTRSQNKFALSNRLVRITALILLTLAFHDSAQNPIKS